MSLKRIISFDGGGIRGLVTALLLKDLDDKYQIISKADGFVGTSTGGLLALALAKETSISTIIDVYENDGKKIFKRNELLLETNSVEESDELLVGSPGIAGCRYVNSGLEKIAQQWLGSTTKMSDVKKYFVAVNSAQLWSDADKRWTPCVISNENQYSNMTMVDAALATSAAPTYFPPYLVQSGGGDLGYFADGGVFASNPSMVATAEVLSTYSNVELDSIRLLSLGTGRSPEGIKEAVFSQIKPEEWGFTKWLRPFTLDKTVPPEALLQLTMDTAGELAHFQAGQVLGNNYQRANFTLCKPYPMDNWKDVPELKCETEKYMTTSDWQAVRTWVEKVWLAT